MLQNLVGLGSYDEKFSPLATRKIVAMSILMGSSLVTCSINLYFFIGNVKVATELMFCAAIYVIVFCSFFTVIQNRSTVRGFFFEIQKRVEESKLRNESVQFNLLLFRIRIKYTSLYLFLKNVGNAARGDNFYLGVERFVHKLTKLYFIATLGGSFMYGFCPFLVVFYYLAFDTYSLRVWSLHYNNVW